MIKSLLTASLAVMLSVNTALALSCIRPDPARSFTKAAESEDRYVVLLGTFALPDDFTQPDGRTIKQSSAVSRFSGRLMTGEGFNEEVSADLTIELSCSGDWCGDIKPDTTYLAYVLQTEGALSLSVDACQSDLFAEPTEEILETTLNCATGGPCDIAN